MATIKQENQENNTNNNNGLAGQNLANQPKKGALNKEQAEKELAAIALRIEEIARQIQGNPQLPASDVQMVSWLKEFEHLITVSNVIAKNTPNIGIEFVHNVAFAIQKAKEAQTETQLVYAQQGGNEKPHKIPGIEALLPIDITEKEEKKKEKTDEEKGAIVDIIEAAILGAQSDKLKPERQRIRHTAITNVLTEYMTGDKNKKLSTSNEALQEKKSNIMDSFLGEEIRAQEQQQIEQEAKAKSAENFLKYMATRKNMPASIIIGDVINSSKELAKHREKVKTSQEEMENSSGGALSSLFGDDDNQNSKTQGQSNDAGADKNVTTKDPKRGEEQDKKVEAQDDKKEQEKQAALPPELQKLSKEALEEIQRIKKSVAGVAEDAKENKGKSPKHEEGKMVGANVLGMANKAVNGPAAPKLLNKGPELG